ncbi:hypothetical protein D3C71_412330 [compost metagenome]
MKSFFKTDLYVQVFNIICALILLPVVYLYASSYVLLLYIAVGIIQLISYLIRLSMDYKKSTLFRLYGILMMPVWAALLMGITALSIKSGALAAICLWILFAALFLSPIMAIVYAVDCWKVYKAANYKIQKFLHLVNK